MSREKRERSDFPASLYSFRTSTRRFAQSAHTIAVHQTSLAFLFSLVLSKALADSSHEFPFPANLERDEKRNERKSYDAGAARHLPKCVYFPRDNHRKETIKPYIFLFPNTSIMAITRYYIRELIEHKRRSSSRVLL